MRRDKIEDAIVQAEAFLQAAKRFEERENNDPHFRRMNGITGFRETGALRRASLDLTRALARMRSPQ